MSEQMVSESSHWSYPAEPGTGLVWMGIAQATEADYQALYEMLGQEVGIDNASACGLYDRGWNCDWYSKQDPIKRPGGLGSRRYFQQHVGAGITFYPGQSIWHFNEAGDYVKKEATQGIHKIPDGDSGYLNASGPAPGSEAERILGSEEYLWDTTQEWYYVAGTNPQPINAKPDSCPNCGESI